MRIHLDGIGRLDITAAATLRDILGELRASGLDVELLEVTPRDRRLVDGVVGEPPRRRGESGG